MFQRRGRGRGTNNYIAPNQMIQAPVPIQSIYQSEPILEVYTPVFNPPNFILQSFIEPNHYKFGYIMENAPVRYVARCKIPLSDDEWYDLISLLKNSVLPISQQKIIIQYILKKKYEKWQSIAQ